MLSHNKIERSNILWAAVRANKGAPQCYRRRLRKLAWKAYRSAFNVES
jgi:hypothetical protein